jgi:hypothetical protein
MQPTAHVDATAVAAPADVGTPDHPDVQAVRPHYIYPLVRGPGIDHGPVILVLPDGGSVLISPAGSNDGGRGTHPYSATPAEAFRNREIFRLLGQSMDAGLAPR